MANPAPLNAPTPILSKRALSLYFRVGCDRQLLLYMYTDVGRAQLGMPPRQGGRAGLGLVGRHGYEHQAARVEELRGAFGADLIRAGAGLPGGRMQAIDLLSELQSGRIVPYQLIVEARFGGPMMTTRLALRLDEVRDANGNSVDFSELIPDLIQILPPLRQHRADNPALPPEFREEVLPDGTTVAMDDADNRVRLRVADIKLSSEPGAHYFAETVFYSMALAGWLRDNNLEDRFAVAAVPAVMPGSFETSALISQLEAWHRVGYVPSAAELAAVLEDDLEIAPVEAFAPRIRELTMVKLPQLLRRPWNEVPYHVDYRCGGCEFLGDPNIQDTQGHLTQDPLHCWSEADRTSHLSRVFGLSRGAREVLQENQIQGVQELAAVTQQGANPAAFEGHHGLRARRTVFPARAQSLQQNASAIIPNSGGDALMPRWPDLHIGAFLDYDPATAYTVAIGVRAFWKEPLPFGSALQSQSHRWGRAQGDTEVFLIDRPTLADERREFLRFLSHLRAIFRWVATQDAQDEQDGRRNSKTRKSTYQIYLWDEAQRRHFVRLVSRHLGAILADPDLRQLAWLFPPPELLSNPENESRRTPYTLVYDVVQNTVAIAAPHHYTLLDVARRFDASGQSAPSVHPLYRETLSNLAPPERIHEFWRRQGNWQQRQQLLVETVQKKLAALGIVVRELERQLGSVLSRLAAPQIPDLPRRPAGLAPESYLWLEFTRLNGALQSLDVDRVRAMPPHEREARFRSARLVRRIVGSERIAAWADFRRANPRLPALSGRIMLYELTSSPKRSQSGCESLG